MSTTTRLLPYGPPSALRALAAPDLSVVIVNYRQWDECTRLVDELEQSSGLQLGRAEALIVDNHSPADRQSAALHLRSSVSLHHAERNHGYAWAINQAARHSQGDWLLILNPDVALPTGFVDGALALAERLERDEPRTGIVGFHLRNADGSRQHSVGRLPTLGRVLAALLWPRSRRKYIHVRRQQRHPVPWVTGCCLLVRRQCFEELGGFDEDFFLYYEDVDLCLRAAQQGWGVHHEPALRAIHQKPLQQRTLTAPLRLCTRHALMTYAAKHWPAWQQRVLAHIIRAESRYREARARLRGDALEVQQSIELRHIIDDVLAHDLVSARRRVEDALNRHDPQT